MTEVPADREVGRLAGVESVAPATDYMDYIIGSGMRGVGVPDIAAGKVDVAIAESGISLQLQMSPILAANAEREQAMLAVMDQMFFDLVRMWLPAYENMNTEATIVSIVEDALPKNRETEITEITNLLTAKMITVSEARAKLIELGGWDIKADSSEVLAEAAAAAAAADPFGNRMNAELNPAADPAADPNAAPVGA